MSEEVEASAEAEGEDVDVEAEVEGQITTTSQVRWKHLSSLVALSVVIGYSTVVLVQLLAPAFGISVGTVSNGTWATYSVAFFGALGYSIGIDALRAASEIRGK